MNKIIDEIRVKTLLLPNAKIENELVDFLKKSNESEAFEACIELLQFMDGKVRVCFIRVICRFSHDKTFLAEVLDIGLNKKLVSELGGWLAALIPRLGQKRVRREIEDLIDSEAKEIACYHFKAVTTYNKGVN